MKGINTLTKDYHKAQNELALFIYNETIVPFMKRYHLTSIDYGMGGVNFYKDGVDWNPYTGAYSNRPSIDRLKTKINKLCKHLDFLKSEKVDSIYLLVTFVNPNKERMYQRRS